MLACIQIQQDLEHYYSCGYIHERLIARLDNFIFTPATCGCVRRCAYMLGLNLTVDRFYHIKKFLVFLIPANYGIFDCEYAPLYVITLQLLLNVLRKIEMKLSDSLR